MIIDPDFLDHWRTRMVVDALGGDEMAPTYIIRLWAHCQARKSDRHAMPPAGLKAQCRAPHDAATFEQALSEAGFVQREGEELVVLGVNTWLVRGRELDVSSTAWAELRVAVFLRDGYKCRYCGELATEPECDHITPLSLGGKSVMDNLATACMPCNRSKGAKPLAEWRGRDGG